MWARKRIDTGWSDLAAGFALLCSRGSTEVTAAIENEWHPNTLTCLSVRTTLDLAFQSLELPSGSEVLVSAITIPDMVTVIQNHGLVPVPVDLCPDDLSVDLDSLATAVTDRTRLILVAHLFGSTMPMQPIVDLAERHGLLIFEDCAQAFSGEAFKGHPASDFAAFSFGPIKTATALGGALAIVRDSQTLSRMREIQSTYPAQSRLRFGKRIARYAVLKALGTRLCYRVLTLICRVLGHDIDRVVGSSARNFPSGQLITHLRQKPSPPLLALLRRRLLRFESKQLEARAESGRNLRRKLDPTVRCTVPANSTNWVFAIRSQQPKRLVGSLRAEGFDATTKSSLRVLSIAGAKAHRAPIAESLLPELVFVPAYPEIPPRELERMAKVINNTETSDPQNVSDTPSLTESTT